MIVLIDTGASVSIISRAAARKHAIRIIPSNVTLKVANNLTEPIKMKTEPTEITVENKTCE